MLKTILVDSAFFTERGQKELNALFDSKAKLFQSPKPPQLIAQLIQSCTSDGDLILDFFAGSGTTGQAVLAQNAIDGGSRRCVLVQLPEPLNPANEGQREAAEFCDAIRKPRNLAELTKERLRRAARKIKGERASFAGDLGFRTFKLDSSNIRSWNPDPENLEQTLLDSVEHLKPGRTEADVLYELLLRRGLDLCAPIETRLIATKKIHCVGDGVLFACLAERVVRGDVEALAAGIVDWHEMLAPGAEATCVFRDDAFEDDVVKTNMAAILQQHGLANFQSI